MTEQILSQEEIDALLSAMAKGEVELEEEKNAEPDIRPYDFTSKSIMLRDQFDALEEVYDKFSHNLGDGLSALLQRSMEAEFVSTEMVRFGDFLKAFSSPTSFVTFSMAPLIGSALAAVEPKLVFSLIDCMFGGDGRPLGRIREFTAIERRMIQRFSHEVLKGFEDAWRIVYPVSIAYKKMETKPEFVHLVAPNDFVIVIVFSVSGGEFSGNLHLCLSYLMLEPIKDKLSSRYLREKDMEHTWNRELQRLMREIPVSVVAELGKSKQTIKKLIALQADDVIKLDTGPENLIRINVENVPKYTGFPGIVKGNRAVQVAGRYRQTGGN